MKPRFVLLLLILFPNIIRAQSFQVENYGITEGLPSNEIYQIYQDKKGFIWFATDNGVVRFDGKEMKTYHIKQGLVDPVIFGFHEDVTGRIWFRSFSGKLAYFKNDSIFEYRHNSLVSPLVRKNLIHALHHDDKETMWLVLNNEIISITKAGELSRKRFDTHSIIYKSFPANSHIIGSECVPYIAKSINLNGKEYPLKLTGKNYENNVIQSIYWDDKLLVSLGKNIFSYDGISVKNIFESSSSIISLSKDHQNNLWIGYLNHGVERYANHNLNDGWTPAFLANLSVTKVLEDKEGGMWFSTLEKGVYYEPKQTIEIYTLPYQSKIKAVTKNSAWILAGNLDGKLIAIHPDTKEKAWEKKFDYPIISLFLDHQKDTWISTGGGAFEFDDNFQSSPTHSEAPMVDFTESSDGILWAVGGERGSRIIKIDGQNRNQYRQLKDSYRAICVTDSLIYLAGRTGLEIYSRDIRYLDSPAKLLNLKITEILQANDTTLFLATSGSGFLLVNEKTLEIRQFDTENNLMANNIYCALINHSQLWMGTENGVIKTNIHDLLNGQPNFSYLNKKSGLASDQINQLIATDNAIWAFTEDKISIIPDSLQNFSNTTPTFYLKSMEVNQTRFDLVKNPELRYNQNDIAISFGFVSYNNNESIRARFRLSPKDPWVYAENRELQFFSLSPGSYTLSLEYSVNNHHWMTAIDQMAFFINPPWWKAWYYQLIGLLIAALSILLYFKWRLRRSRKQQQLLLQTEIQITERERSRIAKDLHDTVGTNLAAVKMAVSQLLRKHHEPLSENIESQLQEIIKETKEIIYHLVPPGLERLGLFVLTQNHVARLNHTAKSIINLSTSGNDVFNAHLNIVILRIIQELLSNSLKHAQATVITIAINTFENHLNFLYEDNGIGFNKTEIKEGLGLVNIQSRVESLQGNIKFETGPSGTFYTINIPYPNSGNKE